MLFLFDLEPQSIQDQPDVIGVLAAIADEKVC
jgi:hypothetical protein